MTCISRGHPQTDGRVGTGHSVLVILLLLCWGVVGASPAVAQTSSTDEPSLIERYEEARRRLLVRRLLLQEGGIPVLPPIHLPTPTDSLRPSPSTPRSRAEAEKGVPFQDVRAVSHFEREWFRQKYSDVEWSFLGVTTQHSFFDTTRTPDLRARLQAQFGDPTQTLADAPLDTSTVRAQFEYWFIVNDSIPVQVTDARGPRGRGLILTAERRYRDRLTALRDSLLAPLYQSERVPYVDYYYDRRRDRLYRTGFDGADFFLDRISRTDLVPGRRPRLDSSEVSRGVPSSTEEES